MAQIAPSVTAQNPHEYREQMARIAPFAKRIHVDFSDGKFAPVKLINPIQAYWPEGVLADLHLMMVRPSEHLETVISLSPQMVIIHAESEGDLAGMILQLRALGIKTGLALLQDTQPATVRNLLTDIDHALIFSGKLGHYGGVADLDLLKKVREIKSINPIIEIGWDGGVSADNASQLALGGVDVLNTGGAIQKSEDPAAVYSQLVELTTKNIE